MSKSGISFPDPWDFFITANTRIAPDSKLTTEMRVAPDSKLTTEARVAPDSKLTMEAVLRGQAGQPIALRVEPLAIAVTGERDRPVSASVQAELVNLPRFTYEQILSLLRTVLTPRIRMQFPQNTNFGISVFPLTLFGVDALSFRVCGESQVIIGEYVPNRFERCEEDCDPCDPVPDCCA
jgi:hypothetical protein